MRTKLFGVAVLCGLVVAGIAVAQEKGNWRAASSNAKSTTGDLIFTNDKIAINFQRFPIAQIRALEPAEASAVFEAESGVGSGNLYRVSIPGDMKFLRKNSLCGSEETDWVVTYVSGKSLRMALFSGQKIPTLTSEAMVNATDLCGIYSYVR